MKVDGERDFEAPRETVWRVLNDPQNMAQLIPGVESFEVQDDRHWKASVKIPLGLGGLSMTMNFEKIEERPPEFAKMVSKGQGVGAMMNMETSFSLDEAGAERTHMRWEADVKIAGPVGSMGQRVLQPIVNQQVGNVLNVLEKQVEEAKVSEQGAADEGREHAGVGATSDASGSAGTPAPTTDIPPPETGAELHDEGPPAEGVAEQGSSGAEEGLNPWAPQSYEGEGEGPTSSTEG
jgi:carbon monoxide dehydrogenase subunit G